MSRRSSWAPAVTRRIRIATARYCSQTPRLVTAGWTRSTRGFVIAALNAWGNPHFAAGDWGLWRTCRGTIERCRADIELYELESAARELIQSRLRRLWEHVEATPKTGKWKRRSRLGERVRWYQEPEEE
jgi:hypothetical protein